MSRINDALKSAQKAQQENPPPGVPPPLPVESKPGGTIGWMLPAVITFLIVTACFLVGLVAARRIMTKVAGEPDFLATQQVASVLSSASNAPPVPATNAPPPGPKLQGIVYAPARPWAIVNGKTVYVGDQFGEFRVKAISRYAVTLEGPDGSQEKLELSK